MNSWNKNCLHHLIQQKELSRIKKEEKAKPVYLLFTF